MQLELLMHVRPSCVRIGNVGFVTVKHEGIAAVA